MTRYHQGRFKPKNLHKYMGNAGKIFYRSGLELQFMGWCDKHQSVIKWASEEHIVPYISPLDNRPHRYFVDFFVEFKNGNKYLIEIKPDSQTRPPKKTGQKAKFIREMTTWAVNESKWKAAAKYAEKKGWKFKVLTDKVLRGMG